eukprot:tig00021432_g21251.t1
MRPQRCPAPGAQRELHGRVLRRGRLHGCDAPSTRPQPLPARDGLAPFALEHRRVSLACTWASVRWSEAARAVHRFGLLANTPREPGPKAVHQLAGCRVELALQAGRLPSELLAARAAACGFSSASVSSAANRAASSSALAEWPRRRQGRAETLELRLGRVASTNAPPAAADSRRLRPRRRSSPSASSAPSRPRARLASSAATHRGRGVPSTAPRGSRRTASAPRRPARSSLACSPPRAPPRAPAAAPRRPPRPPLAPARAAELAPLRELRVCDLVNI